PGSSVCPTSEAVYGDRDTLPHQLRATDLSSGRIAAVPGPPPGFGTRRLRRRDRPPSDPAVAPPDQPGDAPHRPRKPAGERNRRRSLSCDHLAPGGSGAGSLVDDGPLRTALDLASSGGLDAGRVGHLQPGGGGGGPSPPPNPS